MPQRLSFLFVRALLFGRHSRTTVYHDEASTLRKTARRSVISETLLSPARRQILPPPNPVELPLRNVEKLRMLITLVPTHD